MNIVFVAITNRPGNGYYKGTEDAVAAAMDRSGCCVRCVSDLPMTGYLPISFYWESADAFVKAVPKKHQDRWSMAALCRWFVVRDFAKKNGLSYPIAALDTDVIVFQDLNTALDPFAGTDFCLPIVGGGTGTSAAYVVGSEAVLNEACERAMEAAGKREQMNDMDLWGDMWRSGRYSIGDLYPTRDDVAFDASIHDGQGFETEACPADCIWGPETKKLTWINGVPHCTRLSDGRQIPLAWIHCWGSYKNRTRELITAAKI